GAKDRKQLSHAIGCSITLTAAASLVILIFGLIFVRPLLEMLNTPASIIDWCDSYLTILMIGGAGVAYYNILSGILRGMGDSFSALIYLLIATVINIVLDLFFVAGMGMGVPGVALATVIAQAVSALLCFRKLMKMTEVFDITLEYLKPTKHHSFTMIRLGLPSGLTQMIMSLAMIIVQSLTNSFGELFIAANVIIMRVDGFAMMPNLSFGNSMTTYTGQNVGAKRYDRVEKGSVQGAIMAVGVSTTITILILIFGKYLMGMFTTTEELINLGMSMMCILAPGYIAVALSQSLSGVMRGAGDTMTPMWISLITTVALRVPLAYGISYLTRTPELPTGRSECIFISLLVSWCVGALLNFIAYKRGGWKQKAVQ
ncbi:MAG: MATE family efflux transporter, partial [Lachnospiraceae bacterium]|nr:MATE family efflux transporter [Lachnospiraceae bacterium]